MTADEAREMVRAVYKDVWLGGLTFSETRKVFSGPTNKPRDCKELGVGRSEDAAWLDAASKLPTPIPTPASEAKEVELCPSCGYTEEDARFNMDHHLCKNTGNAPWELNPTPTLPSTEESGEPTKKCDLEKRKLAAVQLMPFIYPQAKLQEIDILAEGLALNTDGMVDIFYKAMELQIEVNQLKLTPATESADYLRGKLDGFNEGVEAAVMDVKDSIDQGVRPGTFAKFIRDLKRGNS